MQISLVGGTTTLKKPANSLHMAKDFKLKRTLMVASGPTSLFVYFVLQKSSENVMQNLYARNEFIYISGSESNFCCVELIAQTYRLQNTYLKQEILKPLPPISVKFKISFSVSKMVKVNTLGLILREARSNVMAKLQH